jgi:predicted acylesterase/phospholipase RssA
MREKELRLALVCYGGISLAVYMHGITKEIWHLTRASRAHHDGAAATGPSEAIYQAFLREIEAAACLKLRVLTDIVAGASAGGINGIFLAQAVATGQSLDPLTELWLEEADVDHLIDPAARAPSRFSKIWAMPLVWAFANRQEDALMAELDTEAHEKLARFMRSRWFEPPFGGPVFTRLLLKAFDAMATGPVGPRLLPDEQPLDLFVTVTDFHGHQETLRLNSPTQIDETEHRLTIDFRDAPGESRSVGDVAELAFAARATASFPGAFPPFTVAELDTVLSEDKREWRSRKAFLSRILPRRAAAGEARTAILIDGSILANAPFRPAIDALRNRPARREVDRRFVYIDPKPGIRSVKINRKGDAEPPGFFATIFGALSDLPREQPIRDNLDAIAGRSMRISRMRAIVETLRPDVEASVATLFGRTLFIDRPNPARLAAWRAKAEARAAHDAGHSYLAYCQLRLAALLELATPEMRAALQARISALPPTEVLMHFDARYRIRRLRFVARSLATLAERYPESDLDHVRDAVFKCLAPYIDLDAKPELSVNMTVLDATTDATIAEALAACPKAQRRAPLLAYLGFPFYDVATLALLQGEGLDEFDTIKVDRISPDDAQSIRKGGVTATLKGVQFNSFGAFFSRAYRENDYLWGRLHGAERMIDIVSSTLPANVALPAETIAATKRALFDAILDEEAMRCSRVTPLIVELRAEIAAMGGKARTSDLG